MEIRAVRCVLAIGRCGVFKGAGLCYFPGDMNEHTPHTPSGAPKRRPHPRLEVIGFEPRSHMELPLHLCAVQAGFPSPADDYIDKTLDLNEHLVRHPAATFFVRVCGDSMRDARLHDGDILIVDRAETPRNNQVVVAALDGELTVKRIRRTAEGLWLMPENPEYPPIEVHPEQGLEIWGVVTHVIHSL